MEKISLNTNNEQIMNGHPFAFTGMKCALIEKVSFNSKLGEECVGLFLVNVQNDSLLNEDEFNRLHCGVIIDGSSYSACMYKETSRQDASNFNDGEYKKLIMTSLSCAIADAIPYISMKKDYVAIIVDFLKEEVSIYRLLNAFYR